MAKQNLKHGHMVIYFFDFPEFKFFEQIFLRMLNNRFD